YVELAAKRLAEIRLSTPVRAVRRQPDHAEVRDGVGQTHRFDAVVIATHPDQALRLLDPPTNAERDVLSAFTYTPNPARLQTDAPRRRPRGRAAGPPGTSQLAHCGPAHAAPRTPYPLNRLQNLPGGQDYIVTLGAPGPVDPRLVIDRMDYAHPAYTPASVAAQ